MTLTFSLGGQDHQIELIDDPTSETLAQLKAWVPADITLHSAKIAGCHIYWPTPILARLERGQDIHAMPPGSFLYYPDRQYCEIIYDALQAETASVTVLGRLKGDIGWLRDFADHHRRRAGFEIHTARLSMDGVSASPPPAFGNATPWDRIRQARRDVWAAEPAEIGRLISGEGLNIPFGPMATADGYFRAVQESLWQLWVRPDRFDAPARRAAAVNALDLGIGRIGHFCHMSASQAVMEDGIAAVADDALPLQDVLAELILYAGRMSSWVDLRIPWYEANELTKRALGRSV